MFQLTSFNITFAMLQNKLFDIDCLFKVNEDLMGDGYRYIYLDSLEDFGVDWVNKLLATTLFKSTDPARDCRGDFWVTFDPYQGLHDSHFLMKGRENKICWHGNLAGGKLPDNLSQCFEAKRLVKLEVCFRMPRAMIDHIDSEKVLPTSDLLKAQDVTSFGVIEENTSFPQSYSTKSLALELAKQLYWNIMQQGMHPGHSAVVFHGEFGRSFCLPLLAKSSNKVSAEDTAVYKTEAYKKRFT